MARVFVSGQVLAGAVVISLTPMAAQAELVVNGGFETGNFFPWFRPPSIPNEQFFTVAGGGGHSGEYFAAMSSHSLQWVSQFLPTTPGADYELSFWMARSGLPPDNLFVRWGGQIVLDVFPINSDYLEWKHFTVQVHATLTATNLEFGQDYFPGAFLLDDVSVVQVPAPGSAAVLGVAGCCALRRRRRSAR